MTGKCLGHAVVLVCLSLCTLVTSLLVQREWSQIEGEMMDVSIGPAGVWGVTPEYGIRYRQGTYNIEGEQGDEWISVDGQLKQLDVGTNVLWGIQNGGKIFIRTGITKSNPQGCTWQQIQGTFKQVSVSQKGHVWAVDDNNKIWIRLGASIENPEGDRWLQIDGEAKYVSVGEMGVWVVVATGKIYYRSGTFGDVDTTGTKWLGPVYGTIETISSGDRELYAVKTDGTILSRKGMSQTQPLGYNWKVGGFNSTKVADVLHSTVWSVSVDGEVLNKLTIV